MDSEKEEIKNTGHDGNVAGAEGEMDKPDGPEEESQSMEVENGIGTRSYEAGLKADVVKDSDANDGVKHCVGDVQSDSVMEKGSSCETPLPNEGKDGTYVPPDSHIEDSERNEESVTDGTDKRVSSNEVTPKSSLAENNLKEEVQKDGELVKAGETNKELDSMQLLDCSGAENRAISHENEKLVKTESDLHSETDVRTPSRSFLGDPNGDGYESGTEEEQMAFMHEVEVFYRGRGMDFKPPKFYQEQLNLLKLWRWVIKLGGYEQVSSSKLWRQVGESFKPPKTCTTVSYSFRTFYEKALLEYEKHKVASGELPEIDASFTDSMSPGMQGALSQPSPIDMEGALSQPSGIGRVRRDAAARAMQGWHALRASSNDELGDPIIKDKSHMGLGKREKQLNSLSLLKRPKQSPVDHAPKVGHLTSSNSEYKTTVVDIGPLSDWVKINVQRTKDCFEVYVLVPGLSREEVRVQSDPAGRLVISGQPEHLDNPWGVTPFKKVVSLPSRIDPHQTSAVVTLHGQLFIRVPFEQSDS